MSKPDLSSLYKLEFYRKQDNWRLASKPRRRGKAKGSASSRGDFNKTYVLNKSTANITTQLNDAFLETDPDSAAEDNGHAQSSSNQTQIMASFSELWSNSDKPEKEEQNTTSKPQNSEPPTPEPIPKTEGNLSPNLELPKVFLPKLPLHADLWSEKVDFELNDLLVDSTPQSQVTEKTAKATDNPNILVNLLKKHKFFINGLDNKVEDVIKENINNQPQDYNQKPSINNEQEQLNKLDILTKLKQKIYRANLLNNNYLIPNANQQPVLENNNFESYFNNVENTIEDTKKSMSINERNFEITNQGQRNFERNFIETTLPSTFQNGLEINKTDQMISNNINASNFKNNVKPFKNLSNDFQYIPTDFTESAQNCYLNQNMTSPQNMTSQQNMTSPHNQYIINNYKPIFFNQRFKPFLGDYKTVTDNYEAYLRNCQILSKTYHPEAVTKNFQADAKSFQIDPKNLQINHLQNDAHNHFHNDANNFQNDPKTFQINPNNFQNDANAFQNDANNFQNDPNNFQINPNNFHNDAIKFQFDAKSSNIVDHNFNSLPYLSVNQIPNNHQVFVRNPQEYNIAYDPEAYSEGLDDPCFEWSENFKDQVLDDIDGIWSEGQGALDTAAQWLNLVDEENIDPNLKQICTEMDGLNMNTTSSTDSATFMRGAALVPHSSEISLSTAAGDCEKFELASLVKKHARVLKCLLSRASSEHSLCVQTQSPIAQQKRHSATNTTPDQSCDYYPTRDVGSNTPLIDNTNPIVGQDFDTKLDLLREKLAQDQAKYENCAADQKLYTVFTKFQQHNQSSSLELDSNHLQRLQPNFEITKHFEASSKQSLQRVEPTFQLNERQLQEVEPNFQPNKHKFQSPERQLKLVEHNVQLAEHNFQPNEHKFQSPDEGQMQLVEQNVQPNEHNLQQIEHKSGHHNMMTVNKIEMGPYKQNSINFGPYGRQRKSHNKNPFNYLSTKKINQLNICGLD